MQVWLQHSCKDLRCCLPREELRGIVDSVSLRLAEGSNSDPPCRSPNADADLAAPVDTGVAVGSQDKGKSRTRRKGLSLLDCDNIYQAAGTTRFFA